MGSERAKLRPVAVPAVRFRRASNAPYAGPTTFHPPKHPKQFASRRDRTATSAGPGSEQEHHQPGEQRHRPEGDVQPAAAEVHEQPPGQGHHARQRVQVHPPRPGPVRLQLPQQHHRRHLGDELFQDAGDDQGRDDRVQGEEAPHQGHAADQQQRPVRDVESRVDGPEPTEEVAVPSGGERHPRVPEQPGEARGEAAPHQQHRHRRGRPRPPHPSHELGRQVVRTLRLPPRHHAGDGQVREREQHDDRKGAGQDGAGMVRAGSRTSPPR